MNLSADVCRRAGRLAADNPQAMVSVLDRTGVVTYASPSTQQLIGYAPSERIGKESAFFIHPADKDHASLAFQDAVLNGDSVDFGIAFVTKSGDRLPVRCTLHAINDPETEELFVIAKSVPVAS